MATFLDVTGLQHFSNIFAFIFVWLLVFALLSYTKTLGGNNFINALIGLFLGLFTLISPNVSGAIIAVAPWAALVFVFGILMLIAGNMFGGVDLGATSAFRTIFFTLIIIAFIVGILAYARDKMDVPDEINEESDFSDLTNVFFHPKFIGVVFVLVIAVFTVGFLTTKS